MCVHSIAYIFLQCSRVIKMNAKEAVVARIKTLCDEKNIRINELANISGMTPSTIYSMTDERRRDVSILTVKKICDGLEITLKEFFNDPLFESLDQEIK